MQKNRQTLVLVSIIAIMWLLLSWATYKLFVTDEDRVFDFYPRWYGARQMLQFENPYSRPVHEVILRDMGFDEYIKTKNNFLYLATITYILVPFWLLPYDLAVSLWAGLQLLFSLSLPLVFFTVILRWRIRPLLLAGIAFFSTFVFRHSMHNYLFAQFLVWNLANFIFAWWFITEDRKWPAAIVLVFATVRPDGVIFVSALLFDLLLTRRFKIIRNWLIIMVPIFILSLIQAGWWIPDFLDNAGGYRECCLYSHPPGLIGQPVLERIFSVSVVIWGAWLLLQMRPLEDRYRIPWSLSVVIIVYLLVFTQSKDYTLIYALIPLWLIVWVCRGRGWLVLFSFVMLTSPWFYFAANATLPQGNPVEQTITPLIIGAMLTYQWLRWRASHSPGAPVPEAVPLTAG